MQLINVSRNTVFITDNYSNVANASCTHGPCLQSSNFTFSGTKHITEHKIKHKKKQQWEENCSFRSQVLVWSSIAF